MPRPVHRSILLYVAAAAGFLLCSLVYCAAAALPDPAPLDPGLFMPSATPSHPGAATIPAFPEQSNAAAGASSTCPLDPNPRLLPAVLSACDSDGALSSRLRCCPALAAWLFAAYAPTALAARPARPASAAPVDMPVPPDDSEACAGATDRALRSEGAASLPRPPGANGTCDVAFCYCGVRLRRLTCGAQPTGAGQWVPAEAAARRLQRDCARPGVPGCSKCIRALTKVKAGSGGAAASAKLQAGTSNQRDCQLMGLIWLLQRNATRYGAAATAVIRALMAADEASTASVEVAAGPAACSLPVDDMPLPAEYARRSEAAARPPAVRCIYGLILLATLTVVYSL